MIIERRQQHLHLAILLIIWYMSFTVVADRNHVFSRLQRILNICDERYDTPCTRSFCDGVVSTMGDIIHVIEHIPRTDITTYERNILVESCETIRGLWSKKKEQSTSRSGSTCTIPRNMGLMQRFHYTGERGRPRVVIDIEQVQFLRSLNFNMKTIAAMLLVGRSTLYRHFENNTHESHELSRFSNISDPDLKVIIEGIHQNHPHSGTIMLMGHLRAIGLIIQRERVREMLRIVDPVYSALRYGFVAQRRTYSVAGPNSLWHIDGHHALVRWRLVTHGGIDGYSRLIVFLRCSSSNTAATVATLFIAATREYGIPSRVRADHGSENVLVRDFMEDQNGQNRGSFIAGRSVHNTRIERLWRDVYYGVCQTFYSLFYHLEGNGILNIESERDMFCIHYIFLPRINQALSQFMQGYNNHGLRTEGSWTPLQIWVNAALRRDRTGVMLLARLKLDEPIDDLVMYGIDPDAPPPDEEEYALQIPDTSLNVTEEQIAVMNLVFDPLEDCNDYGVGLYIELREQLIVWGFSD